MIEYKIPQEVAHQIAVSLYQQAIEFVSTSKRNNPDAYEIFKADYLAKQATLPPAPIRRRYIRYQPVNSR